MNLPAHQIDIWTKATDDDKLRALAMLAVLPSRQALSADVEDASFFLALEGVTKHGLSEAVKFILRGALGHTFFPSPPELRIQCDKAMEWHDRERERIRRQERYVQERKENNQITQRTPEAVRRQQEAYRRFLASYEGGKQSAEEAERAEVRARYGMSDEVLAGIKDQPVPSNFKRLA